ncbi:MAG TPA: TonB C-terminal domain-containing protein [Candidatus Omnitrophota bacterium]|nr:TonB C-terminal domain-containing protein [Candidatus Omnitrophota bacterium]HQL40865.1 TonB C-terminal domain-containing protein [Candidatus Omnitrophota bacterium]
MENRIFTYTLIVSLLIHIGVLWNMSYAQMRLKAKTVKMIEVVYPGIKLEKKIPDTTPAPVKGMKVDLLQAAKASLQEQKSISSFMKDMSKLSDDFLHQGQKAKVVNQKPQKRKVSVPAVEAQQINNPVYINYYQIVRSRIRDRAYANYERFESGEVYLTFMLDSQGSLKRIKIIEERTRANQYLRQISMRSIEESNPFPPFPSDLQYPELSFNVIISYEVE